MHPDLNRLKVFHQVYVYQCIIKAAETLHISQPAVSQQIKKLEAEINVPLFTRLHKRIVPTAAAHKLFKTVNPFLDQLACDKESVPTKTQTIFCEFLRAGIARVAPGAAPDYNAPGV